MHGFSGTQAKSQHVSYSPFLKCPQVLKSLASAQGEGCGITKLCGVSVSILSCLKACKCIMPVEKP